MNRTTRIAHLTSVVLMGLGVLVATGDGFVQSYAGLYHWAIEQGLTGWKAETFPLLVDLFVIVGELGLFALALEGHRLSRRGMAWVDMALPFGLASAGWGVSLAFNVGAVDGGWSAQITAAVAPVASMLGLLVLLRTVHRLITRIPQTLGEVPAGLVEVVADPAGEGLGETAPDGYGQWAGMPPVGQSATWWPLPSVTAGQVADDAADTGGSDGESGHDFGHPNGVVDAGHGTVADLTSAIRSARAAGKSRRQIAEEFEVSRYRVNKALDGDAPTTPATLGAGPAAPGREVAE